MGKVYTAGKTSAPVFAYWFVALGICSFSFSPILVRLAGETPALSLALWRNGLSVLILAPFAWHEVRPTFKAISRSDFVRIAMAGIMLGVHFYLFFEAIKLTTVASAAVFVSVSPIFLAMLGFMFLRERLSLLVLAAIGIAVAGGVLIAYGDASDAGSAPHPVLGNALALTACLFVSIYLLIGRVARQHLSWLGYVFPLYTVSTVTLLVLCFVAGAPIWGFEARVYGLCALMAIGPHVLGHGSFNYAVKYFPAAILGLWSLLEPVGSTALAFWLFGEFPGSVSLAGMAITLMAIMLTLGPELFRSRRTA